MVLIYTVYNVCLWLNAFPVRSGITGGFSPRELITCLTVNFKDHCKFDMGGYVEASTDGVITNNNSERTHACIFLGPSGNRQGLLNCFDLETGKFVVRRSAKQLFYPDRIMKKAEKWGKKGKSAVLRGQIKFLNRYGEKFDWDNDNLEEIKVSKMDEKLVQPDFIAGVPGIEVQGDYDNIIGTKPDVRSDKEIPSFAQSMAEASENYGRNLEANTQVKARRVDIGSSDGSVIDLSGDDDKPDGGVYHVKQESVIIEKAPDDEEGDYAPSLVYGSDSNSSDDEDDDPSPTGQGHRVIVATKNYTPSHNNQTYGDSHVETSTESPPASKSRKSGTTP